MAVLNLMTIAVSICFAFLADAVAITGPQGGVNIISGQRPFRQEISTFKNSGPAFDLYILSLQQFQRQNQSALLSYYQVAVFKAFMDALTLHGMEFKGLFYLVTANIAAYFFPHGTGPMWHCLRQQIIWNNAQQIAATYAPYQRSLYQAAATTLRIPYWDWAFNTTMPDLVNSPMITVNSPNGVINLANPLYNYTFHPQPSAADFPPSDGLIAKYHSTVRYPDISGQSQPDLANLILEANAQAIHDATYQLIADQPDYAPFSNTGFTGTRGASYNSLENMHNTIHSLVGSGGHMSYIPYAGFDPIFWLHHANVDRLFAIWQAIYPDSYTTPEADGEGTFTNAPGDIEDVNTPLTPFHSDNVGTLYTSATARSTRPFGYTYPEVVDWGVNATQLSSNTRMALNELYNPTGSISTRSLSNDNNHNKRDNPTAPYTNTTEYEYYINVRVPKAALNRPFFIHFFLGDVPPSPSTWSFAPSLIASQTILYYPPASSSPSSSTSTTTTLSYGQVPLTHALLRYYQLPSSSSSSLDPSEIIPLLEKELSWKIQDVEHVPVETGMVPGLKVFVVGRVVREKGGRGDVLRGYGAYSLYRDATRGKAGGLEDGEGW